MSDGSDGSDDRVQHDERDQGPRSIGEQRVAAWIGGVIGLVVAIDVVYLLGHAIDAGGSGAFAFGLAILGVPLAVVTLFVCGLLTRRYRGFLVSVGFALLVSPFLGLALNT
ncbi:hypothetical protein BIU98_12660 [Curtobacterium sp. MMLR14_010]|uniref:hypothetical protein n=1 Tax=Curtobacterium sp. MMLR14_010 TaxID=1898743 RepID=UPI0008DC85A7|nr:hypothetical protein [Curtobacterium sp. MMLR14_010]OII38988.1 hypothetical protein BIU98_12660 [Curtobacterium sp. MMLR14_010]